MSDRLICKAKRTDNGEWVEGSLITGVFFRGGKDIQYILCPDKADYDCFEDFNEENGIFEVDLETVCRCTGLPDKNGNIIFEKDAIKVTEDFEEIYVVEWDEDIARYVFAQNGSTITDFGDIYASDTEVIGNIFDNPELLKQA